MEKIIIDGKQHYPLEFEHAVNVPAGSSPRDPAQLCRAKIQGSRFSEPTCTRAQGPFQETLRGHEYGKIKFVVTITKRREIIIFVL